MSKGNRKNAEIVRADKQPCKVFDLTNECGTSVWEDQLDKGPKGVLQSTYNNHVLLWENCESFKGKTLRLNEMTRKVEYDGEPINSTNRAVIRNNIETESRKICKAKPIRSRDVTNDFIYQYSYENRYNPIKDYLVNLTWDGKPRLETMFVDWLGVRDSVLTRKKTVKWMVTGVKRIFEPGCQTEGVIILTGKQGIGKSTFVLRLGKGYTLEANFDLKNEQKCAEQCISNWIISFDELRSILSSDPETAKAFLTRTTDTTRLAYREDVEDYPRHCVFIGCTNDTSILKDYSGNVERRYWVMKCEQEDKRYVIDNFTDDIVDQLWAEAYAIYKENPDYNISLSDLSNEEFEEFRCEQRNYKSYMEDDIVDLVKEILDRDYVLNKNGCFRSMEDFKNQITNINENYKYVGSVVGKIDKIPFSYVNWVIRSILKTNRKNKWIAAALDDEWLDVAKINYNSVNYQENRLHCLVRKNSKFEFEPELDL